MQHLAFGVRRGCSVAAIDLRLQVVELLLVRLLDPVDQVAVHEAHETERRRG